MTHILKEEKYADGSLKSREIELHGQHGQQVIVKEAWYPPQVDPENPWQATDVAQQRSGQQEYKENYVNGQKHGVQERWYDDGQQANKENYANNQKHGIQEAWHENGQQWCKENYVNGQQHGIQEEWFDNGQRWYKENYANGQKHGIQEEWSPSGVNPEYPNGRQKDNKYYLDEVEKSQQAYQSYVEGLASEIQAAADFEERGLSGIIAGYLLP
jgi:antitoxin component YwqK of YwqJK toxin-antitoxin module